MLFSEGVRKALDEALQDERTLLCGQLVNYSHSALTVGLERKYASQVITFPVAENLMNSAAMGLSLAGKRPIMVHERFDFCVVGMDALVNHIPLWQKKCRVKLPLVMLVIVGHGRGQGPQQNKDFTHWFKNMPGWTVFEPRIPDSAYLMTRAATLSDSPTMLVIHRELY